MEGILMTKADWIKWEIHEHEMALVEKHPKKRKQIRSALLNALEMLSDEIQEVANNHLEIWEED
jgi:hypothetical protein